MVLPSLGRIFELYEPVEVFVEYYSLGIAYLHVV